jgi:glucosamine--fructose-6-phosphate aminotransferase (isomerizing)
MSAAASDHVPSNPAGPLVDTSGITLLTEVLDQPAALRRLADFYASDAGRAVLDRLPSAHTPAITGMGASYHCALVASQRLQQGGLPALALESIDLVQGQDGLLDQVAPLVYISQSGASAEVPALLDRLASHPALIAVTNDPESPLARAAPVVMPLLAGRERTVATKTYLNSLATLWVLTECWLRKTRPRVDPLRECAARIDAILAQADSVASDWLDQLSPATMVVFAGHGPHGATARQAAMMQMEWVKRPALGGSVGALRHGPIEIAQPGLAVVLFAAPGPRYASTRRLAEELHSYGAQVLLVEQGWACRLDQPRRAGPALDEFLAPLVDIIPVQLYVEAHARRLGLQPGFRHIGKIITAL